jgi:prepilin-type N-terminal cleavage/methylation domain-containing protein
MRPRPIHIHRLPPVASGKHAQRHAGFTLVEIMIVISIVAIVVAAGVPTIFNAMKKDALRRAVNDVVEGCSHARAQAILQGVPSEFIIRAEDGQLSVGKVRAPAGTGGQETAGDGERSNAPAKVFSAKLHEDIIIQLIDVNFNDLLNEAEARVRFFPNGTSD